MDLKTLSKVKRVLRLEMAMTAISASGTVILNPFLASRKRILPTCFQQSIGSLTCGIALKDILRNSYSDSFLAPERISAITNLVEQISLAWTKDLSLWDGSESLLRKNSIHTDESASMLLTSVCFFHEQSPNLCLGGFFHPFPLAFEFFLCG